jgi:glycosyltransferase involved in cell wall biosynthesis
MLMTASLDLRPLNDVRLSQSAPNCWDSANGVAQFEIGGLKQFAGRWICFGGTLYSEDTKAIWPRLHFDCGDGYAILRNLVLPECSSARPEIDYVFFLPRRLRAVRLDLLSTTSRFFLRDVHATLLSKYAATMRMLGVVRRVDGNLAAARHALQRLPLLIRTPSRYPLHERYREIQLGQGYSYSDWVHEFEPTADSFETIARSQSAWPFRPTISMIMPVYNTAQTFLCAAVDSVIAQCYPNWELCIADDASSEPYVKKQLASYARSDSRIKVVYRQTTGGISAATNSALCLATGQYIALLDHDDLLHPLALHYVGEALARNPNAGLLYTDEDKLDAQGRRYEPYFKCDFNYELLLAQNMISHLGVYRRDLVSELGGLRSDFDGSQDYDLALRASEKLSPSQIIHVPRVLYHWRATRGSTALSGESKPHAMPAARAAVSAHCERIGKPAVVTAAPEFPTLNRVRFSLPCPNPHVSIIIPTRDGGERLKACLESIERRTSYSAFDILLIDNGSRDASTLRLLQKVESERIRVIRDDSPFNFSALNNRAMRRATGEYVCLMNDDIEVITPDWIEEMLSFAAQSGVGAVGARLWFPNGLLQHAGVVLGLHSAADHVHRYLSRGVPGYFGRAVLHQCFSAVTGACLMVRKSTYESVGGLDEILAVSFNDIDFCLRVREAGFRNVWTPYAEFVHHESASRGRDISAEQRERARVEVSIMERRWGKVLLEDPAYSPNLTLDREDFSLAWPPRLDRYDDSSRAQAG